VGSALPIASSAEAMVRRQLLTGGWLSHPHQPPCGRQAETKIRKERQALSFSGHGFPRLRQFSGPDLAADIHPPPYICPALRKQKRPRTSMGCGRNNQFCNYAPNRWGCQ
jgi:hypothetical protein